MRVCHAEGCKERHTGKGFIVWCSAACGSKIALARLEKKRQAQAKAERKADREKKQQLKRRQDWVKDAQDAFNRYVRLRDIAAGHGCIDCGKPFEPNRPGGSIDAGHYLSRGSAPHLKFDERNVFAQRKNCNRPGGATRDDFRAGVVARIGEEAVSALESDQSTKKYTIEDLKAIKTKYRALAKALTRGDAA